MKTKIIDSILKQLNSSKKNSAKAWCLSLLVCTAVLAPNKLLYAQTAPVVQSVTRYNPASSVLIDESEVTFRVQFSKGVLNVDATDFEVIGSADATLNSVASVNDSLYEVSLKSITGTGTLGIGIKGTGSIAGTNNIGNGPEIPTIDQNQTNDYLNQSEIGQTFTATTSKVLRKITIYKNSENHSFSGTATLTIYSGEYGADGTTSLTSEQVTFTSNAGAQSFELTDKPDLETGDKYSFVFTGFSSSGYAFDSYKNAAYSGGRAYFTGMDIEGSHGANFDLKFQVYEQEVIIDEALSATAPEVSESYRVASAEISDSDKPYTFYPSGGVWQDGKTTYRLGFSFNSHIVRGPEVPDTNGVYEFDIEISNLDLFPTDGTISTGMISRPAADYVHKVGLYPNEYGYLSISGNKYSNDNEEAFGTGYEAGDHIRTRYDAPNQTLDFYLKKEGESEFILQGSGHAFENVQVATGGILHFGVSVKCIGNCTFNLLDTSVPEVGVFGMTQNFGEAYAGSGQTELEYFIKNTGEALLNLSGSPLVSISGADSADFSVITQPTETSIDVDNFASFVVRFAPVTAGSKTATVTILSDDGDEGTYTFDITGTGLKSVANITGDEGWRLLSIPASGVSLGTVLDTLWTQGFTGADSETGSPNVYLWDAENGQWEVPNDTGVVPAAGTGFAVYVYGDDDYTETEDSTGFPKQLFVDASGNTGNVQPELYYNSSGTPANDGWNLLGNPYMLGIDWDAEEGWSITNIDASVYVWSDSAGGGSGQYLTWNGSTGTLPDGVIAPWQGFWIKTNAGDPGITFSEQVQSSGAVLYKTVAPTRKVLAPEIQFNLQTSGFSSKAILMMSEGADQGKDPLDAWKLQSLNRESLALYTQLEDGSALDINALPFEFGETIDIPLDYQFSTIRATHELPLQLDWSLAALPDGLNAFLTDNETGEVINLIETNTYEFTAVEKVSNTASSQETAGATEESYQSSSDTHNLATLKHGVVAPALIRSKETGSNAAPRSRFTLTLSYKNLVSNEPGDGLPETFGLNQNYPNPFNPTTVIKYQLPVNSRVSLRVFDVLGREVAKLVDGRMVAGYHQVTFNASHLASGIYIYRLSTGNSVLTKKLTLIK